MNSKKNNVAIISNGCKKVATRLTAEFRTMVKLLLLTVALIFMAAPAVKSQETSLEVRPEVTMYTFIVNVVPDAFPLPLVGFINVAAGNQYMGQLGFVNANEFDLDGVQLGYINVAGGSVTGLQGGFVNVTSEGSTGVQAGFVNVTDGAATGVQAGFVNSTQTLRGVQLGFINYADELDGGVPLGFISVVRSGGYKSFEISTNDMTPVAFTFRVGVEKFYTGFSLAFSPYSDNSILTGAGIGTHISTGRNTFFNPELFSYSVLKWKDYHQFTQFTAGFGYSLGSNASMVVGPTFSWSYRKGEQEFIEPIFTLHEDFYGSHNRFNIGLRLGFRFNI